MLKKKKHADRKKLETLKVTVNWLCDEKHQREGGDRKITHSYS